MVTAPVLEERSTSWFKIRTKKSTKNLRVDTISLDAKAQARAALTKKQTSHASTIVSFTSSVGSDDSNSSYEGKQVKAAREPSHNLKVTSPTKIAALPLPASLIAKEGIPSYSALFTRETFKRVLDNPVGVHKVRSGHVIGAAIDMPN
jgi:hypothetical protein